MNSKLDEFKIGWIWNLMNSKFDEFKIWWIQNWLNSKFDEFGSSKKLVKNRVCLSFDGPSTFYRGRWRRDFWSGECSPNATVFLVFVVDATKTSLEFLAMYLAKASLPKWNTSQCLTIEKGSMAHLQTLG